jgi:protein-tyrosine phosphatase
MIRHILVVCVGNICRSPMAEALLRDALRGLEEVTVESAGLGALVDEPAAEHSVELMRERGLDITSHRAQQLTPELVAKADLILVMESGHRRVIDANEPTARGKVYRLGEWQDIEIPDPYRQPREAFEVALNKIDKSVADWVERLKT